MPISTNIKWFATLTGSVIATTAIMGGIVYCGYHHYNEKQLLMDSIMLYSWPPIDRSVANHDRYAERHIPLDDLPMMKDELRMIRDIDHPQFRITLRLNQCVITIICRNPRKRSLLSFLIQHLTTNFYGALDLIGHPVVGVPIDAFLRSVITHHLALLLENDVDVTKQDLAT